MVSITPTAPRSRVGDLVGQDRPVPDPYHPAGMRRDVLLVGDQDDRPPLVAEPFEDAEHLRRGHRVQRAGRLVGQDHRRVRDQRSCDRDALLLPARQLRGHVVDARAEPDLVQRRERPIVPGGPVHAGVGQRQLDVLQCARTRDQVEALEHEADVTVADVGERVLVESAHVDSVEVVSAAWSACPGTRGCSSAWSCRSRRRRRSPRTRPARSAGSPRAARAPRCRRRA